MSASKIRYKNQPCSAMLLRAADSDLYQYQKLLYSPRKRGGQGGMISGHSDLHSKKSDPSLIVSESPFALWIKNLF